MAISFEFYSAQAMQKSTYCILGNAKDEFLNIFNLFICKFWNFNLLH